jgi:uncharacterized protein (DUF342 family)
MELKLEVSEDKLRANLILSIEENETIDRETIKSFLSSKGIIYGINEKIIDDITKNPFSGEYLIAQGKPPKEGQDSSVEYLFELDPKEKLEEKLNGKDESKQIDFKSISLISYVKKGDVIAKKIPAIQGEFGTNVYGRSIKPKILGKDRKLSIGKNVELSEDGMEAIAKVDGIPKITDKRLIIENVLNISGNIDYSTGNVEFSGDIFVHGDVKPGFSVSCGGNIEISGVIEAATVLAKGNIIVREGIKGMDKGMVRSEESVISKYIESANIEAKNVLTTGPIINSMVTADETIKLEGRKGDIIGGNCRASVEINANCIGSSIGVETTVEVGIPPELLEESSILEAQLKLDTENMKKVDNLLKGLKTLQKVGKLTPEREEQLGKTTRTYFFLKSQIASLKKKKIEIKDKINNIKLSGKIVARNSLYPNVTAIIRGQKFNANIEYPKVVLALKDSKIIMKGYSNKENKNWAQKNL